MARIKHGTLVADTVTTVTLTGNAQKVEIINRDGADEIFYLVDPGTANPVVEADDNEVLPAAINAEVKRSRSSATTVVKMISAGTPKYTVRVADDD